MTTTIGKMIHLFDSLTDEQKEELKTDLHLIQQVTAASDGETLYRGAPKAHINDRTRAALALQRLSKALWENLTKQ
jgi:hypothetical protein